MAYEVKEMQLKCTIKKTVHYRDQFVSHVFLISNKEGSSDQWLI